MRQVGSSGELKKSLEEKYEGEVFTYLMNRILNGQSKARWVCTWALRAGYALFSVVFLQNLIFVAKTMMLYHQSNRGSLL